MVDDAAIAAFARRQVSDMIDYITATHREVAAELAAADHAADAAARLRRLGRAAGLLEATMRTLPDEPAAQLPYLRAAVWDAGTLVETELH